VLSFLLTSSFIFKMSLNLNNVLPLMVRTMAIGKLVCGSF